MSRCGHPTSIAEARDIIERYLEKATSEPKFASGRVRYVDVDTSIDADIDIDVDIDAGAGRGYT